MSEQYKKKRLGIIILKTVRAFGAVGALFFLIRAFLFKQESFRFKGWRYPIHIRRGTYDIDVLLQFLADRQYEIDYPGDIHAVVDAGANIGLAAVYYANRFPGATIYALEPDNANFEQLKKNTGYYSNIVPVHAGVWHKDAYLEVIDEGFGEWAFTVRETNGSSHGIKAISLDTLRRDFGIARIDILKMDIEGSEKEVFSDGGGEWLMHTDILIVELHDAMREGCAMSLFKALGDKYYRFRMRDENLIFYFGPSAGKG